MNQTQCISDNFLSPMAFVLSFVPHLEYLPAYLTKVTATLTVLFVPFLLYVRFQERTVGGGGKDPVLRRCGKRTVYSRHENKRTVLFSLNLYVCICFFGMYSLLSLTLLRENHNEGVEGGGRGGIVS